MAEGKTKKPVDPKKTAAREAKKAKRLASLKDLMAKDPTLFKAKVDFKNAKTLNIAQDMKSFCLMKAEALHKFWTDKATKPAISEKKLQKKTARREKLLAMLKALEGELA